MAPDNQLLAALPGVARTRLTDTARTLKLAHGEILQQPGAEILKAYFPLDCLISVTITMMELQTVEVAIVGSREMVGLNAFMGGHETTQTMYICQLAGTAIVIDAQRLLAEFDNDKAVRNIMLKYTEAYIAQLSQNVACNRLHTIEQRLARWLLECRDRMQSDDFEITHEFIAEMLGVRRAGITEASAGLQQRGLIHRGRRSMRIINAAGLKSASCECFRTIQRQYNNLLGPLGG
ncbi:Crp/Fnr family transcriptional regulator [Lacipirellula parvula]|uniref:cAMP-binding protein n=1 Tax=Lacipirellula parvula TaxID=2650471 RepID=A0A5K7XD02_9BACT|nr:Crp/Fnr family transcriptional regulator [Lacipirellula parvula]BBO32266.1 cAMP-binding protein [Lacipirellula parvula]